MTYMYMYITCSYLYIIHVQHAVIAIMQCVCLLIYNDACACVLL